MRQRSCPAFGLRVASLGEAAGLVQSGWPSHVICVSRTTLESYGHVDLLHVPMDDVVRPTGGQIAPGIQHVEQIVAFARTLVAGDRLLVHCTRGLNRSPPAALAALLADGMEAQVAYVIVRDLQPLMVPNWLLTALVDRYFNLDGQLNRLTQPASGASRKRRGFAARCAQV
jgi:predicted protein tyrosine phosphatase